MYVCMEVFGSGMVPLVWSGMDGLRYFLTPYRDAAT
jgi:hypothetical protein